MVHGILRQYYKAQKAIAEAQRDVAIELLSRENKMLQLILDESVKNRWEGIEKANTDALLYGRGVYIDHLDGTEYVNTADFYDSESELADFSDVRAARAAETITET